MPTPTYSRATHAGARLIADSNTPREISDVEVELIAALLCPNRRSCGLRLHQPRRWTSIDAPPLEEVTGVDPRD